MSKENLTRQREIERMPNTPKLTPEIISLLTKLCFRQDRVEPVDLIFEFSTRTNADEIAALLEDLLDQKISSRIFITGGNPHFEDYSGYSESEADWVLARLKPEEYPDVQFFVERKSKNTLENVTCALEEFDFSHFERILFVSKAHAAGRSYLTLRKFLPHAEIFQKTYSPLYDEAQIPITAENWVTNEFGKNRVWGEFLRIRKYGERGDIEFAEIAELVKYIERSVFERI